MREYRHSPPLLAHFEGNVQALATGDLFLGWGEQPYFTEFDPTGKIVFDARFVDANSSYRGFRAPWTAAPATIPALDGLRAVAVPSACGGGRLRLGGTTSGAKRAER